jgi:hypothetical protein
MWCEVTLILLYLVVAHMVNYATEDDENSNAG